MESLQNDVLNAGSHYHEMTAILDKIAAGELLGRRQDMLSNQLLSHALEQLLARGKRLRDTEAATINMQLVTWRDGACRERGVRRRHRRRASDVASAVAHRSGDWRTPCDDFSLALIALALAAQPARAQLSVYDPANTARNTITAIYQQYLLETERRSTRSSGDGAASQRLRRSAALCPAGRAALADARRGLPVRERHQRRAHLR